MLFFLSFFNNRFAQILLIFLFNIIFSLGVSSNEVYCMAEPDQANSSGIEGAPLNNAWRQMMDTKIRVETTPGQIGSAISVAGFSGAIGWAAYYGAKGGILVNEHYQGPMLGRLAFMGTGITLFGLFGALGYAISKKHGPQGPFVNVVINPPINEPEVVNNTNSIRQRIVDSDINASSPLETEFNLNPFANLDPLADNPDLAILSCGILFILVAIQCINFILLRYLILKYSSKISSYLKSYPSASKIFNRVLITFEKTFTLYVTVFVIMGYIALIGALVATLVLLN